MLKDWMIGDWDDNVGWMIMIEMIINMIVNDEKSHPKQFYGNTGGLDHDVDNYDEEFNTMWCHCLRKNYETVHDHCHHTGKYRGAAI